MMKMTANISVFIATSLDGFIAREDGSIDWLMEANKLVPPGEDGGYKSFISTVDKLVIGRMSYEKVLSFGEWPYGSLPVIVLSHQQITVPEKLRDSVSISNETPVQLVQRLSQEGAKHPYIDGGITIQQFLAANLINKLTITIIPILLGSGRPLFGKLSHDLHLKHIATRTIEGGLVQLTYQVEHTRQ